MSLIETQDLETNLDKFKIIDCSWHMPNTKRNGSEEFRLKHIPNSTFFNLDEYSKKETDLPHMLVDFKEWEKIVSDLGINNNDEILVYDNSDLKSLDSIKDLDFLVSTFEFRAVFKSAFISKLIHDDIFFDCFELMAKAFFSIDLFLKCSSYLSQSNSPVFKATLVHSVCHFNSLSL